MTKKRMLQQQLAAVTSEIAAYEKCALYLESEIGRLAVKGCSELEINTTRNHARTVRQFANEAMVRKREILKAVKLATLASPGRTVAEVVRSAVELGGASAR